MDRSLRSPSPAGAAPRDGSTSHHPPPPPGPARAARAPPVLQGAGRDCSLFPLLELRFCSDIPAVSCQAGYASIYIYTSLRAIPMGLRPIVVYVFFSRSKVGPPRQRGIGYIFFLRPDTGPLPTMGKSYNIRHFKVAKTRVPPWQIVSYVAVHLLAYCILRYRDPTF